MKLFLAISLLCINNSFLPPEKQKADTVKKAVKPVKKAKGGGAIYPSFLIVNPF